MTCSNSPRDVAAVPEKSCTPQDNPQESEAVRIFSEGVNS